MPPIDMTARERTALARLARMPAPATDIPREESDKLVSLGLAVKDTFRLRITTKGQLELLRQRYRDMPTEPVSNSPADVFIDRLEVHLKNGFGLKPVKRASNTGDAERA